MSKKIIILLSTIVLVCGTFVFSAKAALDNRLFYDKDSTLADGSDAITINYVWNNMGTGACKADPTKPLVVRDGKPGTLTVTGTGNKDKLLSSEEILTSDAKTTCYIEHEWELTSTKAEKKTITYKDSSNPVPNKTFTLSVSFTETTTTPKKPTKPEPPVITSINGNTLAGDKTLEENIKEGEKIDLEGTTVANGIVRLFFYSSEVVVAETKADSTGEWSYILSADLAAGKHNVDAQVTDTKGYNSDKEEVAKFAIGTGDTDAQTKPYTAPVTPPKTEPEKGFTMTPLLWGLIALGIILLIILIIMLTRKKPEPPAAEPPPSEPPMSEPPSSEPPMSGPPSSEPPTEPPAEPPRY